MLILLPREVSRQMIFYKMVILTWRIEERPRKFVTYKLIGGYFEGTLPKKKQFSVLHEFEGIFGPDFLSEESHLSKKGLLSETKKQKQKTNFLWKFLLCFPHVKSGHSNPTFWECHFSEMSHVATLNSPSVWTWVWLIICQYVACDWLATSAESAAMVSDSAEASRMVWKHKLPVGPAPTPLSA